MDPHGLFPLLVLTTQALEEKANRRSNLSLASQAQSAAWKVQARERCYRPSILVHSVLTYHTPAPRVLMQDIKRKVEEWQVRTERHSATGRLLPP